MGGGTIRLAVMTQDFHLTANPQITHFKTVFKRHTALFQKKLTYFF